MSVIYMVIDKDAAVHDREKQIWLKRNISSVRVDSMTEGIQKAINNQYLYEIVKKAMQRLRLLE